MTELDYLRSRASSASVQSILAQRLAWIGPSLFAECLSIVERPAPRVRRWAVRWRLRCVWAANVRRAPYLDSFKQLAVRTTRRLQAWRYGPSAGKRLVDGGAIIALIGGDGSGKSTAVTGLYDWLSARFEVRRAHLGKPTPSLTRLAVAAVRRLTEACVRLTHRKLDTACADSADDPGSPTPHGLLEMLRSVVIARDRWRTYVRIRRFATAGGIVICDRYPLPYVRTMDSPNLHRVPTESLGPVMRHVARLLSRLEQRYYRQILEPDIIAVLRLDPEVAVARKTDEEPHYVRRRSEDLWSVDWTGTNAVVIDASRSKDDVLSELKALIWSRI